MREFVVLSGKGGTGKTSLTAAFARMAERCVVCDGDVDAADLHLLLQPEVEQRSDFMGGGLAVIDADRCTACGRCRELCRFAAISPDFVVDAIACEGCGVCVDLCPEKAVDFPIKKCGEWFRSRASSGPMIHARLGIAEENSGKLVSLVRRQAREVAEETGRDLILTDGPPGIGCPVIASLGGATLVVLVVEPTLSGLHDMDRLIELLHYFRVPGLVCINKFDLNPELTMQIEARATERGLTIIGRIPFDPVFVRAMVAGRTIVDFGEVTAAYGIVQEMWRKILSTPDAVTAGSGVFLQKY